MKIQRHTLMGIVLGAALVFMGLGGLGGYWLAERGVPCAQHLRRPRVSRSNNRSTGTRAPQLTRMEMDERLRRH